MHGLAGGNSGDGLSPQAGRVRYSAGHTIARILLPAIGASRSMLRAAATITAAYHTPRHHERAHDRAYVYVCLSGTLAKLQLSPPQVCSAPVVELLQRPSSSTTISVRRHIREPHMHGAASADDSGASEHG